MTVEELTIELDQLRSAGYGAYNLCIKLPNTSCHEVLNTHKVMGIDNFPTVTNNETEKFIEIFIK